MANTPRPVPASLEVPPGLETIYANMARISHSPADIVMDFAHALPGETKAVIRARLLMSPLSAKLFYRALGENIARYEAAFGEINVPGNTSLAEHLFRPHQQPPEPPASKKE
jgi:hypothetical protein